MRLIECVPNFSEGRDLAKVDSLVEAMNSVPGAWVLDRTSDPDHNRSVITIAGEPDAVAEAALRGVGKAAELIDLTRHSGAHPRIGATDVLPFIPLDGVTIEECVALAWRVGQEIWERYRIPTYFYEAAAKKPERTNLEDVRRGQFEGLRDDTLRDPDRSPDIGEPRIHATAGAIAVGVRKLLIAYNIHLNTSDVSVAKKIAKAIRFSSGGLRYVKAIGVDLRTRGIAQVSINLTDFEQTPLHRVFEMVKREAEQYGCTVVGSEIIGLIPREAIEVSAEYYLQLENFTPAQVLENRLEAVAGIAASRAAFSQASVQTPGGFVRPILETLREAIERMSSTTATKEGGETGTALAIESNLDAALDTAISAVEVFERLVQLETMGEPSMLADLRILRMMAMAAARGALENVRIHLASIGDLGISTRVTPRVTAIEARFSAITVSPH